MSFPSRCGPCVCKIFLTWPKPCINCGIGLVHVRTHKMLDQTCYCDSCDRWRFKDDRSPMGPHDCLCIYDLKTQYPACPHDNRGIDGVQGTNGVDGL